MCAHELVPAVVIVGMCGGCTKAKLQLAGLLRTGSSAQRLRRLRFTRVAAPDLLTHAEVTETMIFFNWVQN